MNIKTLSWRTLANDIFISGQVNNFISVILHFHLFMESRKKSSSSIGDPFSLENPMNFSLETPHIFIGDAPDFHWGPFIFVGGVSIFSLETPRLLLNTQWKGVSNCTPMMMISSKTRFYGRFSELIINMSQKNVKQTLREKFVFIKTVYRIRGTFSSSKNF